MFPERGKPRPTLSTFCGRKITFQINEMMKQSDEINDIDYNALMAKYILNRFRPTKTGQNDINLSKIYVNICGH
jgi:hypothetical protein